MSDEIANLPNSLQTNYKLQHWKGSGTLSSEDKSCNGEFELFRLLNGRLQFNFKPNDWYAGSMFTKLFPLKLSGEIEDNSKITIEGIRFSRPLDSETNIGYASKAFQNLGTETTDETGFVRCELTNFHPGRTISLSLNGFDIKSRYIRRGRDRNEIVRHARAYNYAPTLTYLEIENVPFGRAEQAVECLRNVAALLTIAERGQVSIVATQIRNASSGTLEITIEEPPFTTTAWPHPLVPDDALEVFLKSVYPLTKDRVDRLELAHITEHYFQAFTTGSAWPMSVDIFTAMETLKTAFFRQNSTEENQQYLFWVVPPEDFENNKDMVADVIGILAKHFPQSRFSAIQSPGKHLLDAEKQQLVREKQSLEAQIARGLKRRSYKTQLMRMLDLLDVGYSRKDLQFFIDTRNSLIHQGTPISVDSDPEKYLEKARSVWGTVESAIDLFEQALLSFLNYNGPCNLFSEGMQNNLS